MIEPAESTLVPESATLRASGGTEVRVVGLVKHYGEVVAVDRISFEIAAGELLTLLGPSGCGKTTTLRCVAGLEQNEGGEIWLGQSLVSSAERGLFVPPNRRDLGMVFQSYAIWPHMTVADNVGYPLRMRGRPKGEIRERVAELLDLVGLTGLQERGATKLSGGQQQRVALARALAASPRLLLLDEPLSNLDAKLRDRTRFELRQLQQRLGITALYVTHDQAEAMAISDRILVMNGGRVVQAGTPAEIYRHPSDAFVADFIGAANFLRVTVVDRPVGGPIRVRTASGAELQVHDPEARGDELLLALRPQQLRLTPPAAAAGPNRLCGRVTRRAFLGERGECWVDCSGQELRAYVDADELPAVGDEVCLEFDPGAAVSIAV